MKYVLYEFVDADTASAALLKDQETPVHEVCLKFGDQPEGRETFAIGFPLPGTREADETAQRRRR